ncbi:LysM peptidoglycan-binding domain-containing protein [Candidatus Acidulodesulfobacterium sp. H_13]|uniref:LysM peptidoglycan-binding domain-containing protein n=1 Tax=Candidatus Acidulodesulfobacterium sp. H_13 TaxID=3395470 RepID=UPI003AF9B93C
MYLSPTDIKKSRLYLTVVSACIICTLFLFSDSYASNPTANKGFIRIQFKTTYNKDKNDISNGGSAKVTVVSPASVVALDNNTVSKKELEVPHSDSAGKGLKKRQPDSSDLSMSGLLAKNGNFKNYRENVSHIFPMIINKEIIYYIHYYRTTGRRFFKYALLRSRRYMPMIRKVFKKLGLPNDLAYLAMVESGFSPKAYSYAGASGMWQFMPSTGRLFGLKTNWWVDERRNPVESTYAAGKYLKNLFNKFGSWYLAVAAYNSGELTIERALASYPDSTFWTISQNRPYLLPGQTRRYVPKIIAAAIIAKDPGNFGFHNLKYEKPMRFKQVNIPFSVGLYALAKCVGISEYRLRKMNPELLRNATPPRDHNFMLNIPAENYNIFVRNFKHISRYISRKPRIVEASYSRYKNNITYSVEPGGTLMGIAYKYGVSLGTLERYNGLNNRSMLRIGEKIIIPSTHLRSGNNNAHLSYVTVRPGMTLWSISRRYNVPLNVIKTINHINGNNIRAGQKIYLKGGYSYFKYVYIADKHSKANRGFFYYRVTFGDSLYAISSKFHENAKNIMADNSIKNPNSIYPGEILKITK